MSLLSFLFGGNQTSTAVGYPPGEVPEPPRPVRTAIPRIPCDPLDAIDPAPYGWRKPTAREILRHAWSDRSIPR